MKSSNIFKVWRGDEISVIAPKIISSVPCTIAKYDEELSSALVPLSKQNDTQFPLRLALNEGIANLLDNTDYKMGGKKMFYHVMGYTDSLTYI